MIDNVVIGCKGEVGSVIETWLRSKNQVVVGIDKDTPLGGESSCSFMHVCIPYNDEFIATVNECIIKIKPTSIIVYSTVPVGTCKKLEKYCNYVAHSPIEGQHKNIYHAFIRGLRFVGSRDPKPFVDWFAARDMRAVGFNKPEITELGKLLSTARYGVNIVFAREQKAICNAHQLDYESVVTAYQRMYNGVYKDTEFTQAVLTPPGDKIGGHCVVQNALLASSFLHIDTPMLNMVAVANGDAIVKNPTRCGQRGDK